MIFINNFKRQIFGRYVRKSVKLLNTGVKEGKVFSFCASGLGSIPYTAYDFLHTTRNDLVVQNQY